VKNEAATVLIFGLLVREAFSFWTGHPFDFELWVRLGYAVAHGVNPYAPLPPVTGLTFADIYSAQDSATIAYLPFWPLVTGLLYLVYMAIGFGNRFVYYFLLKQPIILGDIFLAYLLYTYISSRASRQGASLWAARFWALSPVTIIISGIWGMFDSLSMCFILASIMTSNYAKRSFWTGIGIFSKSLALIYAIPETIKNSRTWWGFAFGVGLPALATTLTLVGMGWPISTATVTLASTVIKGGGSMSLWDSFYYLNYLNLLPVLPRDLSDMLGFVWVPSVVLCTVLAFRKFGFETEFGLVQSMLVVTLIFLIFKARVTEQYAIYLLALAIVDVALWNSKRKLLLIATTATVLLFLLVNNHFLIRFLAPVYPDYVKIELIMRQIEPVRLGLLFALGAVFTCLNVAYLISIMKSDRVRPVEPS
jgi:hypothetical protein